MAGETQNQGERPFARTQIKFMTRHVHALPQRHEEYYGNCPICLNQYNIQAHEDEFEENAEYIEPCGHIFGSMCLAQHFQLNPEEAKCPMCRTVLYGISIEEQRERLEGQSARQAALGWVEDVCASKVVEVYWLASRYMEAEREFRGRACHVFKNAVTEFWRSLPPGESKEKMNDQMDRVRVQQGKLEDRQQQGRLAVDHQETSREEEQKRPDASLKDPETSTEQAPHPSPSELLGIVAPRCQDVHSSPNLDGDTSSVSQHTAFP